MKNFGEKIVQVFSQLVHDNREETAGHSQRSTLETGHQSIRDFAKNRYNFMARGQLERIDKLSKTQF